MSTVAEQFRDVKRQMNELREQAREKAKAAFAEWTRGIFEKYPKLQRFSWAQYTPYFNDGDACTFSARTDYVDAAWDGEEIEELCDYTFKGDHSPEHKADPDLKECWGEIKGLFAAFEEEDLLDLFGDHVKVVCTPKRVRTEDYSHD